MFLSPLHTFGAFECYVRGTQKLGKQTRQMDLFAYLLVESLA